MTEVVQLFLALGIIIIAAKAFGVAAARLGQPAVLGELIAGVLIGPSILNLLHTPSLFPDGASVEHTVIDIAELGVLLLMFSAGLEVDLGSMMKLGRTAFASSALGVLVPILLITPLELINGHSPASAIFIGLILAATSVSISAQVMRELGVLGRREGLALLGAAVLDDVLVLLCISFFLAINPSGVVAAVETRSLVEIVIRLVGFLVIATGLGLWFLPRLVKQVERLAVSQGTLVVGLVSALLFGVAAEYFGGIAAITGAFIAGVCLGRSELHIVRDIEAGLQRINYGLLVPVFFVSIGLQANLHLLDARGLPIAILLTLLAAFGKTIGAGAGSLLAGFDRVGALRVGVGMISRGEVSLIVAALGIRSGIINSEIFAEVVLVVLVTTIMTPPLVRWSFRERPPAPENFVPEFRRRRIDMKLVIFITAQTEYTLKIAQAWQKAGATGVTLLEGHGLRHLQEKLGIRDDLPLLPSLRDLFRQEEVSTHLLISVVADELVPVLYQHVTDLLGDLTLPNNGIIFTLDVGNVVGLREST